MHANYRKYQGGWAWLSWAIPAAAKFVGGILGDRENKKQAELDRATQLDLADTSVRRRVADAKAAGLHPLYALGAQPSSYAPVGFQSQLGEALGGAGDEIGRGIRNARLDDIQKQAAHAAITKDYAQATMYANEAARIKQVMNSGGAGYKAPDDVVVGASKRGGLKIESHPLYEDAVKLNPDEMVSRSAQHGGETAGWDHPSMRQFLLPGGMRVLLPASGQGGVPEEIDASMLPVIIGANIQRFGPRWAVDVLGYMYGASPDARRGRTLESAVRGLLERARAGARGRQYEGVEGGMP